MEELGVGCNHVICCEILVYLKAMPDIVTHGGTASFALDQPHFLGIGTPTIPFSSFGNRSAAGQSVAAAMIMDILFAITVHSITRNSKRVGVFG